jgi:hypothetical protein
MTRYPPSDSHCGSRMRRAGQHARADVGDEIAQEETNHMPVAQDIPIRLFDLGVGAEDMS